MDIITYALCKKLIGKAISTLGDIFTLKGNVSSTSNLPQSGNNPGDIYLVGPKQDGSYDEYYWTSDGAWEIMGTSLDLGEAITEENLYAGEDGTGTVENPAEDTILYIVNGEYVKKSGDEMSGNLTTTGLTIGGRGTGSVIGNFSYAQGSGVRATAINSFAQGTFSMASAQDAHAEGYYATAAGTATHAEGYYTNATGANSHAEGNYTMVMGQNSHAEGLKNFAMTKSQHVEGEYNIIDSAGSIATRGDYVHIIGNGTGDNARSNAATVKWNGEAWFAGDIYVGSTSGTNKDNGSKKLATEDYVTTAINNAITTAISGSY